MGILGKIAGGIALAGATYVGKMFYDQWKEDNVCPVSDREHKSNCKKLVAIRRDLRKLRKDLHIAKTENGEASYIEALEKDIKLMEISEKDYAQKVKFYEEWWKDYAERTGKAIDYTKFNNVESE